MMTNRFYESTDYFRDIDIPIAAGEMRNFAAARSENFDAILDAAVARGAIGMNERSEWRNRMRRQPEMTAEILASLPGHDATADRAFSEDSRLRSMADQNDEMMGIREEDRVREFPQDDALPESERLYRQLAKATNAHLFA